MNVLFLCSGNISRSFLAEALFRVELDQRGVDGVETRSAGLLALPGNPPDPDMAAFLRDRDLPVPDHRARALSREDVAWADRILVMETPHLHMAEHRFPESREKLGLLGRCVPGEGEDPEIGDPFGLGPSSYRDAQEKIWRAVRGLVRRIGEPHGETGPC
jgi:protein-tyrosine phosphatase